MWLFAKKNKPALPERVQRWQQLEPLFTLLKAEGVDTLAGYLDDLYETTVALRKAADLYEEDGKKLLATAKAIRDHVHTLQSAVPGKPKPDLKLVLLDEMRPLAQSARLEKEAKTLATAELAMRK